MSAAMLEEWISCLRDAWRRCKGTYWFWLIFFLMVSFVGFNIGFIGQKLGHLSWEIAGIFLGISGIFIAIYFFSEIFFRSNRRIRFHRRRQAIDLTSPPRSLLDQYHTAGLYTRTVDDRQSESYELSQRGRRLPSTEDAPRSIEQSGDCLELETRQHVTDENRTPPEDELRSVESAV